MEAEGPVAAEVDTVCHWGRPRRAGESSLFYRELVGPAPAEMGWAQRKDEAKAGRRPGQEPGLDALAWCPSTEPLGDHSPAWGRHGTHSGRAGNCRDQGQGKALGHAAAALPSSCCRVLLSQGLQSGSSIPGPDLGLMVQVKGPRGHPVFSLRNPLATLIRHTAGAQTPPPRFFRNPRTCMLEMHECPGLWQVKGAEPSSVTWARGGWLSRRKTGGKGPGCQVSPPTCPPVHPASPLRCRDPRLPRGPLDRE